MALNAKQALFVEEYLKCFNATKAALAAGYSPKTAYSQGARLLKNAEIAEAIRERLGETAMSADEVLMRLASIARGEKGEVKDHLVALQLLGKHHKLFVEKSEVTGPNDGPIEFKDASEATGRILSRLDSLAARVGTVSGDQRNSADAERQSAT